MPTENPFRKENATRNTLQIDTKLFVTIKVNSRTVFSRMEYK